MLFSDVLYGYKRYIMCFYKLLIFVSPLVFTILPSGALMGIPIKYLFAALVIIFFCVNLTSVESSILKHFSGVSLFLIFQFLNGYESYGMLAFSEFSLAAGAILIGMLLAFLFNFVGWSLVEICTAYKVIVIFAFMFKMVALVSYWYLGSYQEFIDTFLSLYTSTFGSGFVTMQLPMYMVRIFLQTDLVVALFPFGLLMLRNELCFNYLNRAIVLMSVIVVVIGFSRYNIMVSVLGLCIFFFTDKSGAWYKASFLAFCAMIFILFRDDFLDLAKVRLFSSQNSISDEIRYGQGEVLWDMFLNNYWIGNGFGAYSKELIRSLSSPFSYEQQMLSLLAKWGGIGFSIFVSYFVYLLLLGVKNKGIAYALFALLFFFASFFNPYLFSTNMIVVYLLIYYVVLFDGEKNER